MRAGVLRLFGKRLDTCVIHGIVRREYRDRDDLAQPGERILFKIPCMGPWNAHFLSRLVGPTFWIPIEAVRRAKYIETYLNPVIPGVLYEAAAHGNGTELIEP